MADESNQPSRAVSNVRQGVLCIGCGYDLAGLPASDDAVCPECGLEIALSLRKIGLRDETLEWLERVVRGLKLLYIGARFMTVFNLALVFILITAVAMMWSPMSFTAPIWIDIILGILGILMAISLLIGVVLVSVGMWHIAIEPRTRGWSMPYWHRLLRIGVIALPLSLIVSFVQVFSLPGRSYRFGMMWFIIAFVVAGVLTATSVAKRALRDVLMDLDWRSEGEELFAYKPRTGGTTLVVRTIFVGILFYVLSIAGLSVFFVFYVSTYLGGPHRKLKQLREQVLIELDAARAKVHSQDGLHGG